MSTLKERFEEQFGAPKVAYMMPSEILAFFRQELLALAEEVEHRTTLDEYNTGKHEAILSVAALIRAKADELL